VATLAGIALAVTGLSAMPKVIEEMENAERVYRDLSNLQGNPINKAKIEAEEERIDGIIQDHARVIAKAIELYGYEPLVSGALPDGDSAARIRFRRRYNEAMTQLFNSLKSGGPPTQLDIGLMQDKIEEEQLRATPIGFDQGALESDRGGGSPTHTAAGVLTKAGAKSDAEARASMLRAKEVYCYAVPYQVGERSTLIPSLFLQPYMEDTGTLEPPLLEDMWWAQVTYWIQRDIVNAINALNEEAAQAQQRGEDRWVGIMPVKDLVSIRLSDGYILVNEDEYFGATPDSGKEALPCGTANTVFTGSVSSPSYDVLQVTAQLVMDQRDIPRLIDRICRNKFYTLLRTAYQTVPPNRKMWGKIYGSEPTVLVVLDFEVIMLGSVFRELMPQEVCDRFEIECPERAAPEDEAAEP
jgi:hypothetical protein